MAVPKVYASPYGGKKYHRYAHCNGLNSASAAMLRDVPSISRAEAAKRGLEPCAVCKPGPLLKAVKG